MKDMIKFVVKVAVVGFVLICIISTTPQHKIAYENCKKYDSIMSKKGVAGIVQRDKWSEELTEFEARQIVYRAVALDYKWFLDRD